MKRRLGTKWGVSRNPIDLMNRSTYKKGGSVPSMQVMLNWFSKGQRQNKFKYNAIDTQWIAVNSIISTATLELMRLLEFIHLERRIEKL